MQCGENSLVLEGKVAGHACQIVVDTGATHTIVRADLVPAWRLSEPPGNYIITTAGGETMRVSGETLVDIEIGSKKIRHKVFVANIIDPVILGMDFMELCWVLTRKA